MKSEINRDFYCSAGSYQPDGKCIDAICAPSQMCHKTCRNYHRKFPTPEQFKKEYGEEYASNRPVWAFIQDDWHIFELATLKEGREIPGMFAVVCACTPFGKPGEGWRPE